MADAARLGIAADALAFHFVAPREYDAAMAGPALLVWGAVLFVAAAWPRDADFRP